MVKKKNTSRRKLAGFIVWGLVGVGVLLTLVAPAFPALIEKGYSTSLYRWLSRPLSWLTGLFPFSVAEFLVLAAVAFLLYKLIRFIVSAFKNPKTAFRGALRSFGKGVLAVFLLYVTFYMLWGLNYSRLPFAEIIGLETKPSSAAELAALAQLLAEQANALRLKTREDEAGVMTLSTGVSEMLARAKIGFKEAAAIHPVLGGGYGQPKGVVLSRYWSYTGISGAYFPFTGEANVNIDMPPLLLPATAAHEMAHQRGFAREDEANYLAYFVCSLHPDEDFQYSGTVLALVHTMNALYSVDAEAYRAVSRMYSSGLQRDLKNWREYWQRFEGSVEKISSAANDAYLRANRQKDGLASYGRMVDLLLAQFRSERVIQP